MKIIYPKTHLLEIRILALGAAWTRAEPGVPRSRYGGEAALYQFMKPPQSGEPGRFHGPGFG